MDTPWSHWDLQGALGQVLPPVGDFTGVVYSLDTGVMDLQGC